MLWTTLLTLLVIYHFQLPISGFVLPEHIILHNIQKRQTGEGCKEPELHRAVRLRQVHGLEKYLSEGGDLYATDCLGRSAMHLAVLGGDRDIVLRLLEKKFDLNKQFEGIESVLHFAIINRQEMVPTLIKLGGNVNFRYEPSGESILQRIVFGGNFRLILRILDLGPEIDSVDRQGNWPLGIAALKNETAVVNLLLSAGADVTMLTRENENLLHLAVRGGCFSCVRRFLDRGVEVDGRDSRDKTPIMLAIELNNTAVAKRLYNFGANLSQTFGENERTLLHWAVEKNSTHFTRWLLQKGLPAGKKDLEGFSPLFLTISADNMKLAEMLAQQGADVHERWGISNATLLHWAAQSGNPRSILWLTQQGLSTDVVDKDNWLPLHYAANWGQFEAVKILTDKGSCLNCRTVDGNTPLHYAGGFTEIAQYLTSLGATL